jgi:hypothetical protein
MSTPITSAPATPAHSIQGAGGQVEREPGFATVVGHPVPGHHLHDGLALLQMLHDHRKVGGRRLVRLTVVECQDLPGEHCCANTGYNHQKQVDWPQFRLEQRIHAIALCLIETRSPGSRSVYMVVRAIPGFGYPSPRCRGIARTTRERKCGGSISP